MPAELVFGVVGAGWAAQEHCRSLVRLGGTRLAGVCDLRPEAAQHLAAEFGGRVLPDIDALLTLTDLDALVVTTPSGVHQDAVLPALDRGLAVFVEKPLAHTVQDALAIADRAAHKEAICAVGYQWRALDSLPELRSAMAGSTVALLVSQGIGVTQARSWFGDPQLSGGLVFERASHHIDLQRMIAGEVDTVSAVRGAVPLSGVAGLSDRCEDVVSLTLAFASGAVGAIHVAWTPQEYPPTQSLRIFTTGDAYDLDLDPHFELRRQGTTQAFTGPAQHPFLRQLECFVQAVRTQDPQRVSCTAADAAGTVVVAAAAARALSAAGPQSCSLPTMGDLSPTNEVWP